MGVRSRARALRILKAGRWDFYSGGSLSFSNPGHSGAIVYETNDDTTGPRPYNDHPLLITYRYSDPLTINGEVRVGTSYRNVWINYSPPNRAGYAYTPNPSSLDWNYYKTKAMANMNPNKPDVDLPVFLFELRDFPGMLRDLGNILKNGAKASDAAGAYVAYSFGWAPLISDVGKLISFSNLVNKRLKYLQKTSAKGGARISRTLEDSTNTLSTTPYSIGPPIGAPFPDLYNATIRVTEHRKVWACANVASFLSPVQLDNPYLAAARAALGLNLSAASLWEALPWSWLIDYLGNIGDFLDANRGFIPGQITKLCVMATQTVDSVLTGGKTNWSGVSVHEGEMLTVFKQRTTWSVPVPSLAYRPWFTPHMAGILGSLASSRALKSLGK